MKTKFALAAVAALYAMPAAALEPGAYASLGGMLNVTSSSTPQISVLAAPTPRQIDVSFKAGWGARGAVGYNFSGWRTELEGGYRQAKLGHVNEAVASGKQNIFDVMGNIIFNIGQGVGFQPYLGAGVGAAWSKWGDVTSANVTALGGSLARYDDNSPTGFQYQGIAGVSFSLTPTTDVFADYRYIGTTGLTFQSTAPTGFTIREHKDGSHNLLIGVRFAFGR